MIPRYTNWCAASHGHGLLPNDNGEWVRYSDHVAEIDRLEDAHAYDLIEQSELDDMARGEE